MVINNFDYEKGCDEICTVDENGKISFIRLYHPNADSLVSFSKSLINYAMFYFYMRVVILLLIFLKSSSLIISCKN